MGNGHYILNEKREAVEVDLMTWAKWLEEKPMRKIVSQTRIPYKDNYIQVSTVFLGLDHRFGLGEPLLFETMVFTDFPELDGWMDRYTTYNEAVIGHLSTIEMVREKIK